MGSFLRGLADRKFAESVFKSGKINTLAAATAVTLEKEAERERMEQMLQKQGHEVMEVGAAAATPATATTDQVVSMLETLQWRMERLTMKVAKMETRQTPAVSPRPTTTQGPKSGERRFPNRNRWADDGRPICNGCGKVGHVSRAPQTPASYHPDCTALPAVGGSIGAAPRGCRRGIQLAMAGQEVNTLVDTGAAQTLMA